MDYLVKFSNDLNNLRELSQFTVEEADIFFKCILAYQDGRSVLKYEDVRDEIDYLSKHGEKYFISKCRTMLKRIARISFEYEDPATRDWTLYPSIFSKLLIHSTANGDAINSLEFEVHPDFKEWFFNLKKYLTTFNFADYLSIKTQYTKHLFRHLRQFRTQGEWFIPIEDYFSQKRNMTMPGFRTLIGIPKSYKYANIKQRVILPAIKELGSVNQSLKTRIIRSFKNRRQPLTEFDIEEKERLGEFTFFKNLNYEEIKKSNRVIAIKFTFTPQQPKRTHEENTELKKLQAQQPSNNENGRPVAQTEEEIRLKKALQLAKDRIAQLEAQANTTACPNDQQQNAPTLSQPATQYRAEQLSRLAQGVSLEQSNDLQVHPQYLNAQHEQLARQTEQKSSFTQEAPTWFTDIPLPEEEDDPYFE